MRVAYRIAKESLPAYSHENSPKKYTQQDRYVSGPASRIWHFWTPEDDIDRVLALLDSDVARTGQSEILLTPIGVMERHPDNKIIPFMVARYQLRRQAGELRGFPEAGVLAQLGTPEGLQALNDLIAWEQQQMPAQGFTPWDDPSAEDDRSQARVQKWLLQRDLRANQETYSQEEIDQIQQQLADLDDDIAAAATRFRAKLTWNHLHRLRDDLQAELGQ